jgi:CHAT domain-containing protein
MARERVGKMLGTFAYRGGSGAVVIIATLGLAACARAPRALEEFTTSLGVTGTEDAVLERELDAGVHTLEAHERDVDFRATLTIGAEQHLLADAVPRHGRQLMVVRLERPTRVRVMVHSVDHRTKQGFADLRFRRWPAEPNPSALERGFAALGSAGELAARATTESWAGAAEKLHEAMLQFKAADADAEHAQAAYALAHLQYLARMQWLPAIRAAELAADGFEGLDDEAGVHRAASIRAAAEVEVASGMNASKQRAEQRALYDAADQRLAAAAEYFLGHDGGVAAAYAINMRGIRALQVGDYDGASAFFSEAVRLERENHDISEEARSLANLAWVHNRQGFIVRAANEYADLLKIIERERQPDQYAVLLGNYGFCLVALGEFDRALKLHTEAAELFAQVGNEFERARQLAALGGIYYRTGDMPRALETLRAAIDLHARVGDGIGGASALRVAGNAAAALERHEEALEFLRRSTQLDGNEQSIARTRVLIAAQLRARGDLAGAEAELALSLRSANVLVRANALEERARWRLVRRDYPAAIADLREADRAFVELGLDFNRIDTNTALAQALLATRDTAGAARAADTAVAIVSDIRVKAANPEWRARFLSARYSPYEARIAVDLATGKDRQTALWKAFRTADAVRARSLAELLVASRESGPKADAAIDTSGEALRARLTSQQLRLESRIQKSDTDDAGTLALRQDIAETRARLDAQRASGGSIHAGPALPVELRDVQAKLPVDTAVLAYFVGDQDSHGWVLTRNSLRHARLAGRVALQAAVGEFVKSRRRGGARRPDAALGTALLGPLLEGLDEHRLLVIPDGPVHGAPFAALPLPGAGDTLLVDRFVLGYAPSLALALQQSGKTRASATQVAVVSDPVYAADDSRLRLALNESGGVLRGVPTTHGLTRLPYSAVEARAVTRAFPAADTIELRDFGANAEAVLELARRRLAVLHFATHALARDDSPGESALYLSEFGPDGAARAASRVTADDVARTGLNADLVVLSGCATGEGSELRGEGVLGLTYRFLANGSNSVVASLWPIEDASTARLMSEFYRAYRDNGTAADALRAAQLRVRAGDSTAWSSFVVRANGFP